MHYEFTEQEQRLISEAGRIAGDATVNISGQDLADSRRMRELLGELAGTLNPTGYMTAGLKDDTPLTAAAMAAMEAVAGAAPKLFIPFEMNSRVFGRLINQYGTPDQKKKILTALQAGSLVGTVALSEATMNVVNDPLITRGVNGTDKVTVSGEKGFVVGAETADMLAVVGVLDDDLGVFLVDRNAPGVTVTGGDVVAEYAPLHIGSVRLENCEISQDRVIGPVAETQLLADLRLWENQVLIAAAVGMMDAALFSATAFAKEHRSGGRPVIAYQEVGFKLAEMLTLAQTAQLMAYKAAWLAETGDREAAVFTDCTKVFCSESAEEAAGSALRVLSAEGMKADNPADTAYRYAKFIQIAGTSTEIARVRIGDAVLK